MKSKARLRASLTRYGEIRDLRPAFGSAPHYASLHAGYRLCRVSSIREFEHAGWQAAASSYDGFAAATILFVDPLLQAAGVKSGMRLLDVACGPGVASAQAAAMGARVTGVDFSPEMIAEARRRHPAIAFETGDAEALPFPDASFDAVIANFGIHHVERPERAIAEARRVLVPGGNFAFTIWAAWQDNTAVAADH